VSRVTWLASPSPLPPALLAVVTDPSTPTDDLRPDEWQISESDGTPDPTTEVTMNGAAVTPPVLTTPAERWWSTEQFRHMDRTEAWEDALSVNYRTWQVPERVDQSFSAQLRHRDLAGLRVVECICDPCHGRRLKHHVANDDAAYIGVQITKSGREYFRSGDDTVAVGSGDLVIWTSDRPTDFTVTEKLHKVSLILPWSEVQDRLPKVSSFRGTVLDSRAGIGAVLYSHIDALASQLDVLGLSDASAVRRATYELLAAAMAYRIDSDPQPLSRQYLKRIQDFILDRLQDIELSPTTISQAHGISPRYLHMLFAQTGQSVSAYIRHQRLERCREALASAMYKDRSVAEIAYQWGFNDPAHFSRVFKNQFGHSPSEHRP
jgi:AraC-like DNA-binding protein